MSFDVVPWGHDIFDAYPEYPQALAVGGRGRGASVLFAQVVVKAMLEYGHNVLVGREHQTSIKQSNISLIKRIIRRSEFARYFNLGLRNEIRCLVTGANCEFKGIRLSLEDWRSLDGYMCVWLEEPHMMTNDQLDVIMPSLREPGQTMLASWNPYLPDSAIERLRGFDDGIIEFHTYEDNPYFPQELERVRQYDLANQTPERYGWIWKGLFLPQDERALLPYEVVFRAFEGGVTPTALGLVAGIDIAGSKLGDYTAMVILDANGAEVFSDRIREPNLQRRVAWIQKRLEDKGCNDAFVDCTGGRGEAEVEALQQQDINAEPVIFTNKSKTAMLGALHSALAYDELHLSNVDIKSELIDLGDDGKALTEHDDYVMALAIAVSSEPQRLIWI